MTGLLLEHVAYSTDQSRAEVVALLRACAGGPDVTAGEREVAATWLLNMVRNHLRSVSGRLRDAAGLSVTREEATCAVIVHLLEDKQGTGRSRVAELADYLESAPRSPSIVIAPGSTAGEESDHAAHAFLRKTITFHELSSLNLLPQAAAMDPRHRKQEVRLRVGLHAGPYGKSHEDLEIVEDGFDHDDISGNDIPNLDREPWLETVCLELLVRDHDPDGLDALVSWITSSGFSTELDGSTRGIDQVVSDWESFGLPTPDKVFAVNIRNLVASAQRNAATDLNSRTLTRYLALVYIEGARHTREADDLHELAREGLLNSLDRRPGLWAPLGARFASLGLTPDALTDALALADAPRAVQRGAGALGSVAAQIAERGAQLQDPAFYTTACWRRVRAAVTRWHGQPVAAHTAHRPNTVEITELGEVA